MHCIPASRPIWVITNTNCDVVLRYILYGMQSVLSRVNQIAFYTCALLLLSPRELRNMYTTFALFMAARSLEILFGFSSSQAS
jgi:hypothetical protein